MPDDMKHLYNQRRFERLLPFYITQKLPAADMSFVEDYIAANSDAIKAIQHTENLSRIIKRTGANRNPDASLIRLLANFRPQKLGLLKRSLAKLRARGISPLLVIALLVLVGQGIGYTVHKINGGAPSSDAVAPKTDPHLRVTLKSGADIAAAAVIIEKFGGQIVHSTTAANNIEKIFINVIDKTRIQALIDALMDAGLIEAAAILL